MIIANSYPARTCGIIINYEATKMARCHANKFGKNASKDKRPREVWFDGRPWQPLLHRYT